MALFSKHSDAEYFALQKELEQCQSQHVDLRQALMVETAAKDAEINKSKNLQEENELLLAQLHQVQEELESVFLKNKEFEKQLADLQAKLKAETDAKNAEISKTKDLQEENDLLLAQLHQVQEELERYYLNNKDLEAGLTDATSTLRLARQSLVNTLIDLRGFALPPLPQPTLTGAKIVKLPTRVSPPAALPNKKNQRTSARKSSRSR